jgi:hypothetical protein
MREPVVSPVDPDEELGAVTLLATRQDKSPALLFENMTGDTTGSRILTNMLAASNERYALAVGLDPSLSTAELIQATRTIMNEPIKPVMIAKDKAPVNEVVLTGKISGAALLARRRWPIHRHGRYHPHQVAGHRPDQCRLLPADAARAGQGRSILLTRKARSA